jgi:hypothetical protein
MLAESAYSFARKLAETKRPPGNLGGLFFQGRIVLTEGKVRQNFLAKSYGPKKQGVKEIFDNKGLCFQQFKKAYNRTGKRIILRPGSECPLLNRFN